MIAHLIYIAVVFAAGAAVDHYFMGKLLAEANAELAKVKTYILKLKTAAESEVSKVVEDIKKAL